LQEETDVSGTISASFIRVVMWCHNPDYGNKASNYIFFEKILSFRRAAGVFNVPFCCLHKIIQGIKINKCLKKRWVGDSMFLRNVGIYRRVYTTSKPRRTLSSSPPWKIFWSLRKELAG
jgi:hypothetical protein